MYNALISAAFEADLNNALSYIETELFSSKAAANLLSRTEEAIVRIADNPHMYPLYHDQDIASRGYHYSVTGNYLIFYKINETEQSVFIARFLYGGQSLKEQL